MNRSDHEVMAAIATAVAPDAAQLQVDYQRLQAHERWFVDRVNAEMRLNAELQQALGRLNQEYNWLWSQVMLRQKTLDTFASRYTLGPGRDVLRADLEAEADGSGVRDAAAAAGGAGAEEKTQAAAAVSSAPKRRRRVAPTLEVDDGPMLAVPFAGVGCVTAQAYQRLHGHVGQLEKKWQLLVKLNVHLQKTIVDTRTQLFALLQMCQHLFLTTQTLRPGSSDPVTPSPRRVPFGGGVALFSDDGAAAAAAGSGDTSAALRRRRRPRENGSGVATPVAAASAASLMPPPPARSTGRAVSAIEGTSAAAAAPSAR